jgi:hypothetical protein
MINIVKWFGSIVIIISMILTSSNIYPYNLYTAIPGTLAWIYVSCKWDDKSLIAMNFVALTIYLLGIANYLHH